MRRPGAGEIPGRSPHWQVILLKDVPAGLWMFDKLPEMTSPPRASSACSRATLGGVLLCGPIAKSGVPARGGFQSANLVSPLSLKISE